MMWKALYENWKKKNKKKFMMKFKIYIQQKKIENMMTLLLKKHINLKFSECNEMSISVLK